MEFLWETETCDHSSENYGNLTFDGAVYLTECENILADISLKVRGTKSQNLNSP